MENIFLCASDRDYALIIIHFMNTIYNYAHMQIRHKKRYPISTNITLIVVLYEISQKCLLKQHAAHAI